MSDIAGMDEAMLRTIGIRSEVNIRTILEAVPRTSDRRSVQMTAPLPDQVRASSMARLSGCACAYAALGGHGTQSFSHAGKSTS